MNKSRYLKCGGVGRSRFRRCILLICLLTYAGALWGETLPEADMTFDEGVLSSEARLFADVIERGATTSAFSTKVASAAELIGPVDSRAGYLRMQLQADVNDHFGEKWERRLGASSWQRAQQATSRLAEYLASRGIKGFPVRLSDGSSVRVRIDTFMIGFFPTRGFAMELSVDQSSARTADGVPIGRD